MKSRDRNNKKRAKMVNRQQSSRNLLGEEEQGFDHGITALLLIFFGGCCSLLGATMTGLAYGINSCS